MEENLLKEIGLSSNQNKIYLTLLRTGETLASKLSKELKMNRSLVYQILNELIDRGLVSYFIQNNKRYFKAAKPNEILSILKEKEQKIKQIIPTLEKIKLDEEEDRVEIFKGTEGLKTVLNDLLRNCEKTKNYYIIGGIGKSFEVLPYFIEGWHKRRIKNKITRNLIVSEEVKSKDLSKLPLTKIRYLPYKYATLESTTIYNNKVVHIIWVDNPLAIMIESKRIYNSYITQFKLLWKIAKP